MFSKAFENHFYICTSFIPPHQILLSDAVLSDFEYCDTQFWISVVRALKYPVAYFLSALLALKFFGFAYVFKDGIV